MTKLLSHWFYVYKALQQRVRPLKVVIFVIYVKIYMTVTCTNLDRMGTASRGQTEDKFHENILEGL